MRLLSFLFLLCLIACNSKPTLFRLTASSHSNIHFNNKITENDSINPIDVVNIYNGGGVGIGDFNNDGLPDIYFTGNMVSSKMYLNQGDFTFRDVTGEAGVEGMGRWARGVSVVDINNDGLMDLYVCNTIYKDSLRRRNILYVNQGAGEDGIPRFRDEAAAYGLDIHVQSTMGYFFDYDNDGDLDMYLVVNEASNGYNASVFRERNSNSTSSLGRLYRNDPDSLTHHPVYHNVSQEAGILFAGFGHSATIADLNQDGWKDIYVADDFLSNNLLYINNHDGTFTNRSKEYFKHTSFNAMGSDITDINNDGLADVFELDMSPEDNYRKKMMLNASNYNTFQNFDRFGYQYQYVRNTLQLNQGRRVLEGDTVGAPLFSEISFLSGVAQTDWSWTPLIGDFNNDSYRDLVVTNGFPKDVSDHDFIAYRTESTLPLPKNELIKKIPEIKLHNYAFQNNDGIHFSDRSADWGLTEPTFSNGAAWADLDNDGDLDMVISNINDEAQVYRNTAREKNDSGANFLQVNFEGTGNNRHGLGARVSIFYAGGKQVFENTPYRGYLSTQQGGAHFGLGAVSVLDSVVVQWPGGKKQVLQRVGTNKVLVVKEQDALPGGAAPLPLISAEGLFREVTKAAGISYKHQDADFIDFNIQTTLPHKLSEYCPALAAGDVDGNGLDDLVVGGNSRTHAQVFLQQKNGRFQQKDLGADTSGLDYKDGGMLLLDVNGDGSLDLYATSSGFKYDSGSVQYQDRLYLNDGRGNFTLTPGGMPENHTDKLCVRSMDYNRDGKPDLFISGRVDPWHYPRPVSSFIYRNDTQAGKVKFTDVTAEVAPGLQHIGMVCDALFTDFDGDGSTDLLMAGEWMPVTFFRNVGGRFEDVSAATGIAGQLGWWNSITAGDFRHTGRTDYIVGNTGTNTLLRATPQYPVHITANDFLKNGGYAAIPSLFLPARNGTMQEFPVNGRDEILDKLPLLKKRFNNFSSFATATMDDVFTPEQKAGALRLTVNNTRSCFLRNEGGGKFTMIPLPEPAQVSVINGMVADDFNGDGELDVAMIGNDYGTEVSIGRYDALNGLLLLGDGGGHFRPLSVEQSGIYLPGNGKGLVKLMGAGGKYLLAGSQNGDAVKLFAMRHTPGSFRFLPGDQYALLTYKNGKIRKEEAYTGTSFLSQSAPIVSVSDGVQKAVIVNWKGEKRETVF